MQIIRPNTETVKFNLTLVDPEHSDKFWSNFELQTRRGILWPNILNHNFSSPNNAAIMKKTQELIQQGFDYRNAINEALLTTNSRFTQQLKKLQAFHDYGGDLKTIANNTIANPTGNRHAMIFLPRIMDDMSRGLAWNEAITEFMINHPPVLTSTGTSQA